MAVMIYSICFGAVMLPIAAVIEKLVKNVEL